MTISRNLSVLAENVNSTGQVSLTTGVSGTVPVANGGTGLTAPGTSGNILTSNGSAWVSSTPAAGGVTSVATGNGLSGGTITSTGTLVVACPTFNTVGSYAAVIGSFSGGPSGGGNYSAGTGTDQLRACSNFGSGSSSNSLSGTWKWMGGSTDGGDRSAIACRVS